MNQTEKPVSAEDVSSLTDGEVDAVTAAHVSAHWRNDAEIRARWHRYHLIGDVMRSSELVGSGRDAAFLAALRERLAQEPVVLAPAPAAPPAAASVAVAAVDAPSLRMARPTSTLKRWTPPAALAAGFLMVAIGSASLLRLGAPVAGPVLAQAPTVAPADTATPAAPAPVLASASSQQVQPSLASPRDGAAIASVTSVVPEQATGTMIRDARLDGYLAAHKQFGGTSALGVPSGFLRNATHDLQHGAALPFDRP